jgi:hypothetical protein
VGGAEDGVEDLLDAEAVLEVGMERAAGSQAGEKIG